MTQGSIAGWRIGLIGLGLMGVPMARNLHAAGAQVTVTSRRREVVDRLAAEGMQAAASPRDMADRLPPGSVVIVMVTDTEAVRQVLEGPSGLLQGELDGKIVVDMGTTQVMDTRDFAQAVAARGGRYMDAPVSGGQLGAERGELSIMAGGAADLFGHMQPVFAVLGRRATHVGDAGAGQIAKSANQMIVGMTLDAVAEALALAERAGADPARVRDALRGGFADSRILEIHGQRMIDETFAPGGRVTVQRKDVMQALVLAESVGLELPGLSKNKEFWDRMIECGWGNLDHSAIIKIIRQPNPDS